MAAGASERLGLYRLVPLAAADDPNWDKAPSHGEVLVRAHSPADARIVAAEAEGDFRTRDAHPGHGNTTAFASAFRDDKLYTVVEADEANGPGEGERGVVEGDFSFPVIKPDQV